MLFISKKENKKKHPQKCFKHPRKNITKKSRFVAPGCPGEIKNMPIGQGNIYSLKL